MQVVLGVIGAAMTAVLGLAAYSMCAVSGKCSRIEEEAVLAAYAARAAEDPDSGTVA